MASLGKILLRLLLIFSIALRADGVKINCTDYTRYFDSRGRMGSDIPEFRVASTSEIASGVKYRVKSADEAVREGRIPQGDPAAYESYLQRIPIEDLAEALAKARVGRELLNDRNKKRAESRARELKKQFLEENPTEATLVIGSGHLDISINRPGAEIVLEEKTIEGARRTVGEIVLRRLKEVADSKPRTLERGLEEFHRSLTGRAGRVTYASDRLTDGADVIAILKSAELKRRLLVTPEQIDWLIEARRMADGLLKNGKEYTSLVLIPDRQEALLLAKAMVYLHRSLLRNAGIQSGNDISSLNGLQTDLLKRAVLDSEKLYLEATSEGFSRFNSGYVGRLANLFDANPY